MARRGAGMEFTYGSMVFALAFLAPGRRLAITRNMTLAVTVKVTPTVPEDLLAGSNISYTGAICGRMRLLTI